MARSVSQPGTRDDASVRYKGKLSNRESTVYPLHTWCLEIQLESETARPEYAKLTTANRPNVRSQRHASLEITFE